MKIIDGPIRVTKQLYVDSYLFAVKNDFDNLLLSFIISERAETSPVESLDVLNAEKLPFADPSIFWIHSANSSSRFRIIATIFP